MHSGYRFVDLSEEDQGRVQAMEQELGRKYNREVVLIAYEKPQEDGGSAQMEVGRLGVDSNQRGTTFGYADAHGDRHPTLGVLMNERIAEGEDIRFSDAEPPHREEAQPSRRTRKDEETS